MGAPMSSCASKERDDEVDSSNASVVLENPQHFNGEDGAAGAGYGENED